jgi:hypothetical protein
MRALAFALLLAASPAFARSEKTLAYPRPESFATAVRFIRVDEHLKVIEKDGDAGYVLFELREEHKTFRGSLEVIDVVKDGRHLVRFVIQIEDRPEWTELEMLNKLERKLRAELGAPAPPPTPKPKQDPAPKDEAKKDEPKKDEPKPDPDAPKLSPTP